MNKAKDLGILYDSELSFVEHIENLALSAFKSLGFLMRVSRFFDNPQLIKSLYFAFIVSKLEYASVVWSPYYLRHELILERVQRRFMKFLSLKSLVRILFAMLTIIYYKLTNYNHSLPDVSFMVLVLCGN
ncbi:hypothetical protein Zmor_027519 [Zophobas morio]|uniref:Uncharacterized protein n=1 Tax=Zophobas morio TaxID=2755281 RepID=A0AA38M223_9CUCU|nr:hypothetical protein Zmor_027519 [Zophobas morio]